MTEPNVIEKHDTAMALASSESHEFPRVRSMKFEICGKSYHWEEPPRRIGRELLARINELDPKDPLDFLKVSFTARRVNRALDIVYEFNDEMKKDRAIIDECLETPFMTEFKKLSKFIAVPFAEGGLVEMTAEEDGEDP